MQKEQPGIEEVEGVEEWRSGGVEEWSERE